MIKRNIVSFAALGVFTFLAAGSTPDIMEQIEQVANEAGGGGGGGNVAACEAYVDHYNGLACIQKVGIKFEKADMCPPELDVTPVDMTAYYQCLIDGSKCNGDIPDLAGASSCTP